MKHYTHDAMVSSSDDLGLCPACGVSWKGDSIYDELIHQRDTGKFISLQGKTDEQVALFVHEWYRPPYFFSRVIGIEIQGMYDGISYYQCPDCNNVFRRKEVWNLIH